MPPDDGMVVVAPSGDHGRRERTIAKERPMRVIIKERANGWAWDLTLMADDPFEQISQVRMPLTAYVIVRGWFDLVGAVLSHESMPAWERLCEKAQGQQRTLLNREAPLAPDIRHGHRVKRREFLYPDDN
jgi:hypothetical protein